MAQQGADFCHLHCHSNYSFFDGLAPVGELVGRAANLGQPGIALTDHGNVFGAVQFFKACAAHSVKGVIGMEAYEAVPHTWDPEEHGDILKRKWDAGLARYYHLTLWVQDLTGWENLCALHSASFTARMKPKNQPLIDRTLLERHSEGLMVGLGCMQSRTNYLLATRGPDAAYDAAKWYAEVFEDRAYVEIMGNLPEQQAMIRDQRRVAQKLGLSVVATNDVHYVDREDGIEHGPHHILVQARRWRKKEGEEESADKSDAGYGQWYGTDEFYLKDVGAMAQTGGFQPDELARTVEVLDRVDFDFNAIKKPAPPTALVPGPMEEPAFDKWLAMAP